MGFKWSRMNAILIPGYISLKHHWTVRHSFQVFDEFHSQSGYICSHGAARFANSPSSATFDKALRDIWIITRDRLWNRPSQCFELHQVYRAGEVGSSARWSIYDERSCSF